MNDAPIEIVDYDPTWMVEFTRERERICEVLADWLTGVPEHVGSTAVPGLAAKPIIDIMAPVHSLDAALSAIQAVRRIGYMYFPYKVQAMHWFCKPSPMIRTHHLYLVPKGNRVWAERVAFRDALRASGELRLQYEQLKRALAARHRNDREAYTDAKAPFIASVVEKALGDSNDAV